LKASKKYDKDNPHFHQAMHGPHAIDCWQAMDLEMQALQCVNTWMQMVQSALLKGANILPLTWAFKLK